MSKKNMAIESGNYYDSKGEVANILDVGGEPPKDHPMNRMAVRSGDFYASDGSIHNLDELSGGGSGGTDAYIEAKDRGYTGTKDEFYTELGQVRDKVDKIEGMGLSSNDFTDRDKEVLSAFVGSRVRVVGEPGGTVNLDTLKVRAINNYQPELILAIGTLEGTDFTMSSMSSLTAISITRNTGFEIDDTIQFFNYQDASQIKAARRDSRNGQWTTSITGPFVDEAPLDNEEYVRKNGNWTINSGGAPGGNQWEEPDAETLSTNKRVEFKSGEPIDPDDPDSIATGYIQQRTDALIIQPDWGTEGVKITGRPLLLMDGATLGSPESYQVPWAYIYAMTMYNRIESLDIAPRTDENNDPMDADVGRQDAPYNRVYSREYFIADRNGAHPRVLSEVYQLKEIEFDPTNYAPSENTIPGHLRGIDTALGNSGGGGEKQWEEPNENTLSTQKTIETKEIINEDYIYTEGMNVQEQLSVGGDIMLSGTGLKEPISKIQNIDDRVGDIEETLPLKADLVNGKVPESQLPAISSPLWEVKKPDNNLKPIDNGLTVQVETLDVINNNDRESYLQLYANSSVSNIQSQSETISINKPLVPSLYTGATLGTPETNENFNNGYFKQLTVDGKSVNPRIDSLENSLSSKADLVNGKVPESQLPASTGDGLWTDETENIATTKNVKIETVNPTGTILQLVGGTDKEYLKIIRDNSETVFDTSFGGIVFKPSVEMGGSLKVKGDVFPNGRSAAEPNGLDYRVNALENSILNKRAVLTFKATEDGINSCIWTMERSWNLPDGITVSASSSNLIELRSSYANNVYADVTFNGLLSIRKDGSLDPNEDDWLMYRVFVEDTSFGEVRSDSREVFRGVPCLKNFPITGAGTLFGGSNQTWYIGMEKEEEGSVTTGSEPMVVSGNITMEITFRDS